MILSCDLSSVTLGYCVFNDKLDLIKTGYEKIKGQTILHKAIMLEEILNKLVDENNITEFVIEDRLKNFQSGKSSIESILTLGFINIFGQYIIFKRNNIKITGMNVSHARAVTFPGFHKISRASKILKEKEIAFEFALKILGEERFETKIISKGINKGKKVFIEESRDITDAWILGKAYIIENHYAKKNNK